MRYNKVGDKILVKEDKLIENKIILGKEGENKIQKEMVNHPKHYQGNKLEMNKKEGEER